MSYALGVEHHYMVFHLVNGVRASGVEIICEMDFVRYVIHEIDAFMILIRILSIALPILATLHTPHTRRFDQNQPPQFSAIHQPPQEASIEMLHDQENAINSVQTFLRKFNRYSFFETLKVLLLAWDRVFKIKDALGKKQYKPDDTQELFRELFNDVQNIHEELAEYINTLGWNHPAFYDDDDDDDDDVDYTIAITRVLSIEEPDNSLSMGDEHLDTIPATESDEVLKSSVENLIPIPSESEGIPEHMCDVHFHDNSSPLDVSKDQFEDFFESNDEFSSTDDDSFSIDNIDYVEASPPDSDLVSSEVLEIVILEVGGIDDDILLTIKDDILQISSGSPTTHSDSSLYASFLFDLSINPFPPADRSDFYEFTDELIPFISPPEYDCFLFKVKPNSRDFTKDAVKDISPTKEP
nr:hypothetical protein [Tanacetum cinerariifolium]